MTAPAISPDLSCILDKLRPFQRQAFDFAVHGKPYPQQWENLPKLTQLDPTLVGKGRILLADEMGLGKTVTSLAIMVNYMDEWPLLVLCPASLRHTWPAEIETFLPTLPSSSIYVVSGFDDTAFIKRRNELKIVVATYSLLQTRSAVARVLHQMNFQCVIADESHNLKEKSSQRCQLGLPLLQRAKRLVLLSGTPALARPVELWAQVHVIAPKLFGSYTAYTKQYCNAQRGRFGWDVSGLSNADELHFKLRQIMVRRLKSHVLQELPPKQRSIVPIPVTKNVGECRLLMKQLQDTRLSVDQLVGQDAQEAHFEARRLLMQAYQSSGISKANAVADYVLDWLAGSGTQKILVFAHHQDVMDTLEQAVAKSYKGTCRHVRIDGSVPSRERAVRVRKFQTSPHVRIAILSMTAAGVGLTLTAASSVLFAELHWTPGVLAQAEDRCHRIGQVNAVNVMYCVCKDEGVSIDMRLWSMLGRKVGTLGRVIDGCKTATMNATESSSSATQSTTAGGDSVEEELQRFFAETSANNTTKKLPAAPVKGSIMSFFGKKNQDSSVSAQGAARKPDTAAATRRGPSIKHFAAPPTKKAPPRLVEWSCPCCTFDNSKCVPVGTYLSCEMCDTPYVDEEANVSGQEEDLSVAPFASQGSSSTETPESSQGATNIKAKPKGNVVDLCSGGESKPMKRERQVSSEIIALYSSDDEADSIVTPRLTKKARKSPASSEIIELDSKPSPPRPAASFKRKSSLKGNVAVIDVDAPVLRSVVTPASRERKRETATSNVLSFDLSKNSGRVSIHDYATGTPFHFNFDIDSLITEETTDTLLNGDVKRSSSQARAIVVSESNIAFREDAVKQVVRSLNLKNGNKTSRKIEAQCCDDIKTFLRSYLTLREVEKKALKNWNEPVAPVSLRQTVSQIMASFATESSTERYIGGAKERAVEHAKAGTATRLDNSVLAGTACAWCAGPLPDAAFAQGVKSTYCSQECAEQGRLGRGGMYASTRVRAQVFGLEGGVCRNCGIDAHALFVRISSLEPPERLNALINAKWQLPKTSSALDRLLQNPKEGDFWQADHIQAVAEGGGGCGLENLQTLCTPCHRVETEKLRSRLRLTGGANSGSGNQMDIRSAFLSQGPAKK